MSEFLRLIPSEKLHEIQREAETDHLETVYNLVASELARRALETVNDSTGFYDASQDEYRVTEHPEDDLWIIRGED